MNCLLFRIFNKINLYIYALQLSYSPSKHNKYYIYGSFDLVHAANFIFGDELSINGNVYINARSRIILGENVSLSNGVMLITKGLEFKFEGPIDTHISKEIRIGNNVQIGAGAIVLPGIMICNNVIIGAGSVVTRNIDKPGVYIGSPAKLLVKPV